MDRKNKKPRRTGQSLHLPDEKIEEILSRLPVKSLLRLRCVSKSWRALIGSKRFIKSHMKKSNCARCRVIFNCCSTHPQPGLKQCSARSYMNDPDVDLSPIDDPTNSHLTSDSYLVGNCNGLICILKKPASFFMWNPATKISMALPKLDLEIIKYGFGWDEQNDAYKVFVVGFRVDENTDEEEWIGNLYSSKTNSWKTVENGCLDVNDEAGLLVRGKLHWITETEDYIETFDLKSEVFGMIEKPFKPEDKDELDLAESCGRLSVVRDSGLRREVWVWKKARWVKVNTGTIPCSHEPTFLICTTDKKEKEMKFSPRKNIVGYIGRHIICKESLVTPVPNKSH